ncbi:helix-turn-helix transcriptional regulator [Streptococcus parauberis]|nr:helix-turn-helix transcriptional regulator [Streptococcus parauberis]
MPELGDKIKAIRLGKKLTRESICGDETELSVRQLVRIEQNQSLPTLAKLVYLAKVLDIRLDKLINPKTISIHMIILPLNIKLSGHRCI